MSAHTSAHKSHKKEVLFHQRFGHGEPLLMLHSYMTNGDMYLHILDEFADSYNMIIPDYRGVGRNREFDGPYTVRQIADDAIHLLDDLGIESAHVMGYSMGGVITQEIAMRYPERVRSIVLGCTFAHKAQNALERMQRSITYNVIQRLGAQGLAKLMSADLGGGLGVEAKYVRFFKEMVADYRDDVLLHFVHEIFKFDSRAHLPKFKMPALVIGANQDLVTPVQHSKQMANLIPNAKIKLVDNAGHALIFTHPQLFKETARSFLDRVSAQQQKAVSLTA